MTNPLLEQQTLPSFSLINHKHIVPAVEQQITANRDFLEQLLDGLKNPTWANLIEPLCIQDNLLDNLWSPVGHLNSVNNNNEFREQYEACLPLLTEYAAEIGQNQELFQHYKTLSDEQSLTPRRKKIINDGLLSFKLAGVDLSSQDQARYREIKKQLSQLSSQFSNHVLDATMAWKKHIIKKQDLAGVPESTLDDLANKAKAEEKDGYLLDLEFPTYLAIITYAENRSLREEIYRAYCTKASDQGENKDWDNSALIDQILTLRHELALLLGFDSYAHYSTATKMAKDPNQVVGFLEKLIEPSLKAAKKEFAELSQFAQESDNLDDLQSWDLSFYSEKLRQRDFDISQEALRPFFPEPQVVESLFEITQQLFNVSIQEKTDIDTWHESVRYFEILDQNNNPQASFYLDLYARKHKRGGAWMDSCRDRMNMSEVKQLPVAYLTCNFAGPTNDRPALLTHEEVLTLFHEFGHGIHHMLTQVDEVQVSGINGVEWDAVELPSQLLENYAYHKPSLKRMAKHYQTGEILDDASIDRLIAARTFQAGMFMVRQIEFALFDFLIHLNYQQGTAQWQNVLDEVREQVAVIRPPAYNRFAHSFSHIFAGGYAAGYYSYKWAEVLSADVWEYFEQQGALNTETGQHYWNCILSQGGSKPAMELFKDFRGREPEVEPLLRQQGIA